MKNVLLNAIMILILGCGTHLGYAQDAVNSDAESIEIEKTQKALLIQKYGWIQEHLQNKDHPVESIAEMRHANSSSFVLIKTSQETVLYDNGGSRHCTDGPDINCAEYYKLSDGELKWSKSDQTEE